MEKKNLLTKICYNNLKLAYDYYKNLYTIIKVTHKFWHLLHPRTLLHQKYELTPLKTLGFDWLTVFKLFMFLL